MGEPCHSLELLNVSKCFVLFFFPSAFGSGKPNPRVCKAQSPSFGRKIMYFKGNLIYTVQLLYTSFIETYNGISKKYEKHFISLKTGFI